MATQFKYQPEWQGPLSGRSFEKQTEDAINRVISKTSVAVDLGSGSDIHFLDGLIFSKTIVGDTAFSFVKPTSVQIIGSSFTLILANGGAYTITWPLSVKWASGTAPTLTVSGTDVLEFVTADGGTTWYGRLQISDAR